MSINDLLLVELLDGINDIGDLLVGELRVHRQGQDLVGELLRSIDALAGDPVRLAELTKLFEPLQLKARAELDEADVGPERIELNNPEQLAGWLREAEELLLGYLIEDKE